jgi:hypothetical protein
MKKRIIILFKKKKSSGTDPQTVPLPDQNIKKKKKRNQADCM